MPMALALAYEGRHTGTQCNPPPPPLLHFQQSSATNFGGGRRLLRFQSAGGALGGIWPSPSWPFLPSTWPSSFSPPLLCCPTASEVRIYRGAKCASNLFASLPSLPLPFSQSVASIGIGTTHTSRLSAWALWEQSFRIPHSIHLCCSLSSLQSRVSTPFLLAFSPLANSLLLPPFFYAHLCIQCAIAILKGKGKFPNVCASLSVSWPKWPYEQLPNGNGGQCDPMAHSRVEREQSRRQTKGRGKKKNANGISWMAKFGNERNLLKLAKKRSQKR